jgi:hypothetical protein
MSVPVPVPVRNPPIVVTPLMLTPELTSKPCYYTSSFLHPIENKKGLEKKYRQ